MCRQSNENDVVDSLRRIARRVLNLFVSSETICIIFDRVNRYYPPRASDKHRLALLQFLVELVKSVKVRVRVLTVVNGMDWRADRFVNNSEPKLR